ncbi:MAG: disulfide bond formation protein DsbA [Amnibacterium sp.]|nr:disulfide bond formation protein DsbA [Amnibacterium sp.]
MKIDIWSDVACPWCFIGKRKFEEGARRSGVPVEVEYHSFELSPDTPVDFEGSTTEYLAERKGLPAGQVAAMLQQVTEIAAAVDLHYDFDRVVHTNTVLAHELLHAAKAQGRQLETAEALFRGYFEQGRHVGRVDELVSIAGEAGLDTVAVRTALETHEFLGAVHADQAQAVAYGIRGVPFFVIDGRYGVSGAQDPDVFAGALTQVAAERESVR